MMPQILLRRQPKISIFAGIPSLIAEYANEMGVITFCHQLIGLDTENIGYGT